MTVRFQENAGAAGQVEDLIDSCRKAPWENVTKIWVYANKVQGDPAVPGEIQHITKADGKVHDDPTLDVRAFLERCKVLQREKKKPITFVFVVIGIRTASVRGKSKVQDPEEVEFFRKNIRMGDEEDSDDDDREGKDVSAAKVIASVLKDVIKPLVDGKSEDRDMITFYAGLAKESAKAQIDASQQNVELAKVVLGAQAEERRERKEERENAVAEENETRRTISQHARDTAMVREGRELLSMFMGMWQMSKGFTPPQPAPPEGVPPSDGSIVGDLRVLLTNINADEKAHIKQILGHDLWSMLLQASRASDDDGARAVLEGMMRYVKSNPELAGNIFAAGKIIAGPRFDALISILRRGGAIA